MSDANKTMRLAKVANELGVGASRIIEHLKEKGFDIKPSSKLTGEMYELLLEEFQKDAATKAKAEKISLGKQEHEDIIIDANAISSPKKKQENDEILIKSPGVQTEIGKPEEVVPEKKIELEGPKVVGKVDLKPKEKKTEEPPPAEETPPKKAEAETKEVIEEAPPKEAEAEVKAKPEAKVEPKAKLEKRAKPQLEGPKVIGKIELKKEEKKPPPAAPPAKKAVEDDGDKRKRRRKRFIKSSKISLKDKEGTNRDGRKDKGSKDASGIPQVSEKEIQEKIKATLAKLGGPTKSKGIKAKMKRQKKEDAATRKEEEEKLIENVLQLTEFISVSELANMMGVNSTEVISKCMELGIIVSINQRLDAEVIELVADAFGFKIKFIALEEQLEEEVEEVEEDIENQEERSPIVTVMGHVDHGKTSLLDYVRSANVIEGEAGGITQHIGAYEVTTEDGKRIVFLDTPGHEAFTAMRARGAKITDVAVIVVAADDNIMPQTKEAISHAQAAGVPMVFAINKIDKDNANPEAVKEQLATMNLLVEDWGGKYQSQDISAKKGTNVDKLLEKILLEAELLELKANANKLAAGTIIEATLDKGRGYVSTLLVQNGTMKQGDVVASGIYSGKVKAMFNEKGEKVKVAGPSTAVLILGLNGAPQAGESFKVVENEQLAKQITNKREQIIREQGLRTNKHITLDEIGRRLALGTFKELNVIVKGDVDGSIEALSDSLQKLSTGEIVVNVVHRAVGQITESDVLLASASDAVIIGFQVRPSLEARRLAEKENIEIRLYSIIYNAIEEIKTAMEGMLEPTIEEKILGNIEIREIFKITKVGTVAGCAVIDGKIFRNSKIRLIRDGIVVYSGALASLKRYKDDVKEVVSGQECGLNIKDFNDIKVGDIIESYQETEVKRTLEQS